jgi:FkbM family methyltransferase
VPTTTRIRARPIGHGLSARLPGSLAGLFRRPRVQAAVAAAQRGSLLRPTARFVLEELSGRHNTRTYELRQAGLKVVLEHGSPDVLTFDEVFCQQLYAPPTPIAAALASLGRPPRVLDIGANVGLFGAYAQCRWPGALVRGFEPDPRNAAIHRAAIAANRAGANWRLQQAAAAARTGTLAFSAGRYALSRPAAEGEADALEVPAIDVLPLLAEADLLKLDAEGSEWAILGDSRFACAAPRAIALEYHPELCPEQDARGAAVRLLETAGFAVADVRTRSPRGYGSLWAWRSAAANETQSRA